MFEGIMRLPWGRQQTIINHTLWETRSPKPEFATRALSVQPEYEQAKRGGNYDAAFSIAERLISPEAMAMISAKANLARFDADPMLARPVVIAPTKLGDRSKNLIPIACAHLTAYRLGLGVCRDIYQVDSASRTGKSATARLLSQPEFQGPVQRGREYIIVDDVYTMGGSVASLVGHIESNGGKVSCVSVLATQNKEKLTTKEKFKPRELSLSITDETLHEIDKKHGWCFGRKFKEAVGISLESLTNREGSFVANGFGTTRDFFRAVDTERRAVESTPVAGAARAARRGGAVFERQSP